MFMRWVVAGSALTTYRLEIRQVGRYLRNFRHPSCYKVTAIDSWNCCKDFKLWNGGGEWRNKGDEWKAKNVIK